MTGQLKMTWTYSILLHMTPTQFVTFSFQLITFPKGVTWGGMELPIFRILVGGLWVTHNQHSVNACPVASCHTFCDGWISIAMYIETAPQNTLFMMTIVILFSCKFKGTFVQ